MGKYKQMSLLPFFPGYVYDKGKSMYRGEEVGEGGYVYAEQGIWKNVALLDIASMHPSSIIAECLFGPRFTRVFKQIVDGRVSIKHKAWDECNDILDGKLTPYIQKVRNGEMTAKQLANALKTAINSVYGLTSAAFENAFRDPRNRDNIVAKRGALFMVDLKNEVQKRGFTVAHIKTDSIKIPDATDDIIAFVQDFGKKYGYNFEHEATYDRMCLVNDAVYVARYSMDQRNEHPGEWTATGKQFQVPFVFKTLFSHEPVVFEDMCETFSVSGALYLDLVEGRPDVSGLEKQLAKTLKDQGYSMSEWIDIRKEWELSLESGDPDAFNRFNGDAMIFTRDLMRLEDDIAKGHDYHFVGRVGEFCPVKPGCGGGLLMRYADGRYSAATGSKGWMWMESEMVRQLGKEKDIDISYYQKLVDEAVEAIRKYGNFDEFVKGDG